jgi:hypothetical protein
MGVPGGPVGVIFGDVASTHFGIAISDPSLKRLDYVEAEHQGARCMGLVQRVIRQSDLSYEQALRGGHHAGEERLTATVHVIGYKDAQGRVVVPRTPFAAGSTVRLADEGLVSSILGLEGGAKGGAYIGHVKGSSIPVHLNMNMLAQKHLSVLAKTGAGKSYTVGVILEEFLNHKVPLVILDPHGEYSSLKNPNMEERELDAMVKFGVKPKQFQSQIQEYAIDTQLNPGADRLHLEGLNLEAREIVDILPTKLSGGQVGVLYQAVKDVQQQPSYTLRDVMDMVALNKSNAKWNVLNALEALEATGLFHIKGTPVKHLVRPGKCTIINLKGVGPDVQEVVAARLAAMLWTARKKNQIPPHILVVEEAHNFCPERGVGNAVSGPILRTVASEGRKFGMGLVIVSQRPAKIDKNVLSQCNTQVVLKVTNPNDLKAIVSSVEGITSETADEVQRLNVGTCLVAGGGLTQPVLVDIRPRLTRHGGASIDVVGAKVPEVEDEPETSWEDFGGTPVEDDAEVVDWEEQPAQSGLVEKKKRGLFGRSKTVEVEVEATDSIQGVESEQKNEDTEDLIEWSPPPAFKGDPVEQAVKSTNGRHAIQESILAHRVASRLGVVGGDEPDTTAGILRDLALRQGKPANHFVSAYADIARNVCLDEPMCVRCPMKDSCATFRAATLERSPKGGIRRLWRN